MSSVWPYVRLSLSSVCLSVCLCLSVSVSVSLSLSDNMREAEKEREEGWRGGVRNAVKKQKESGV